MIPTSEISQNLDTVSLPATFQCNGYFTLNCAVFEIQTWIVTSIGIKCRFMPILWDVSALADWLLSLLIEIVFQKKIFVEVKFFKLWTCLVIPSCQTVELLKQIVESSSRALTIKLKYYSTNMFGIQTSNCGKMIVSPVPPFKMWRH